MPKYVMNYPRKILKLVRVVFESPIIAYQYSTVFITDVPVARYMWIKDRHGTRHYAR